MLNEPDVVHLDCIHEALDASIVLCPPSAKNCSIRDESKIKIDLRWPWPGTEEKTGNKSDFLLPRQAS